MELWAARRVDVEVPLPGAVIEPISPDHFKPPASLGHVSIASRNFQKNPNLERDHHFSCSRCFVSLISYALLLSDVLRTGLGLRGTSSSHGLRTLEPDTLLFINQTSYTVQHLTRSNATASLSMGYWLYKYDTTSVAMRAFAEYLQLPAWSPCVLYKESCDESKGLTLQAVFAMIDSLVDAFASHKPHAMGTRHTSSHSYLTLRTENAYKDRLHHYAFPAFFARTIKRTNQAIHFPHRGSAPLCVATNATQPRPYSCQESWTKWKGSHANVSSSVWKHIPRRLTMLAALYPNHSIDAVVFDGAEDFTRGGITCQGRKDLDVVVLTRVRACGSGEIPQCTTVAVDDYRHETAAMLINADSWYGVVALLRVVGQAYTWLRVLLLVVVCTHARRQRGKRRGFQRELTATIRTLFLIPSQVVIYGSSVPIAMYMLAHLIDSPALYEFVSMRLASTRGSFRWNASDFIRHCAVSMRTVWTLGILSHFLLAASTRCVWSPTHGIPGVPEMLISVVASLTIFAQYRSLSFRDTRLLQIHEVIPSRHMHQLRSHTHDSTRTLLNNLFVGSPIDFRCLLGGMLVLCGLASLVWLVKRLSRNRLAYPLTLVSHTLVPYSASALWPKNRLVVGWFAAILEKTTSECEPFTRTATHTASIGLVAFPRLGNASVRMPLELKRAQDKALVMRNTEASRQAQRAIYSLDKRSREIESTIYLINLAVMTDQISFMRLRLICGCRVAIYESKLTKHRFLLPHGLDKLAADIPLDWSELRLLNIVNTKDLDWCDLLRCG